MTVARPAFALVAFGSVAFAACAYYNGLYNANRLVRDAEKAQREGRVGEARSLYSQAAVKAESVAARHPRSRYRDDALLLQGRALLANGECDRAAGPLDEALETSPDAGVRRAAALALGRCSFLLGDFARAIDVLRPIAEDPDTLWSRPARLWRGRSLLAVGAHEAAAADLEQANRDEAAFDLSIAYARLGRSVYARAELEAAIGPTYVEQRWLEALEALGGTHLHDATALVTRLVQRPDMGSREKSRLLLDDGKRWAAAGHEIQAEARFRSAIEAAPDSAPGRAAALELALLGVHRATRLTQLPGLADSLSRAAAAVSNGSGDASRRAAGLRGAATTIAAFESELGDDVTVRHRDLELFLHAENLRDQLCAHGLASAMFLELVKRFPDSPIAPKAMIAAAQLDPAKSDSLLLAVHVRYTASPYTLLLQGVAGERYAALEDSLRSLIAAMREPEPREH